MHWFRHTDVEIVNIDALQCVGHNGLELISAKDLNEYKDICSNREEIIVVSFVSCLSTLTFVGVIVLMRYSYKHRYSIQTKLHKFRLAMRNEKYRTPIFDVYISYAMDDDAVMEEIRHVIEDVHNLKCCIPQRDFSSIGAELVTMEQNIEQSATTLVLLSKVALESSWHKAERNLARHIELFRRFNHSVIHVCLHDLSDVRHDDVTSIIQNGEYIQWSNDATDAIKQQFFSELLAKVYGRLRRAS